MAKIELSPIKIVPGATTVWNEHGPGVDIVMDLKKLSFAPESIEEIYSFHVLDHLFPNEIAEAIANWKSVLKKGSTLYLIVDDFEYVARAFIGGDISMNKFNEIHAHPTNFNRDLLVDSLTERGFEVGNISVWFQDIPNLFKKEHFEIIMSAKK